MAQTVPGPRSVAVVVPPSGKPVGRAEDAIVEVGGVQVAAARGGEHQGLRVDAVGLFVEGFGYASFDEGGHRPAKGCLLRVDSGAVSALLRFFDEGFAVDLYGFDVDDDLPRGAVDEGCGKREQFAQTQS